jgi:SAM-dependent methyltransferase
LSVVGVEPSAGFLQTARRKLEGRAVLHHGNATAIPLGDASVDVVISGLVLNFVPEGIAALAEMARVTARGGTIAAYVWDYAGKMELIRYFWDAAVALDLAAAALDEGVRFPRCRPAALAEMFREAGLQAIDVTAIDIPTRFASFDDYWDPFLGGQGPAPAYAMALDETARVRLRERIREHLPRAADGSIALTARAWAVQAAVPKYTMPSGAVDPRGRASVGGRPAGSLGPLGRHRTPHDTHPTNPHARTLVPP